MKFFSCFKVPFIMFKTSQTLYSDIGRWQKGEKPHLLYFFFLSYVYLFIYIYNPFIYIFIYLYVYTGRKNTGLKNPTLSIHRLIKLSCNIRMKKVK